MMEGLPSAQDLFSKIPIKTSIKEGWWHEICPTNLIADDAPIEFEISGSGNDYIDLVHKIINTKMRVTTFDRQHGYSMGAKISPMIKPFAWFILQGGHFPILEVTQKRES